MNDTMCKVVKAVALVLCFIVVHSLPSLFSVLNDEYGQRGKNSLKDVPNENVLSPVCADAHLGSRNRITLLCTTLQGSLVNLNAYILLVQHTLTKINMHMCVQCTPVHLSIVNDTSMTSPLHEGNLCNAMQKLHYF